MLTSLCVAPGCSNLIGLNGYGVAGHAGELEVGGQSDSGSAGSAVGGSPASSGASGDSTGDAGEGGEANGGSANGGSANGGSAGSVGNAGSAGVPGSCASTCNDDNECTDDSCVAGKCQHQPLAMTTPCGTGQVCDAQGACVRCLDTAAGTGNDLGCPSTAPVCIGAGAAAVCGGCTKATDCADNNECTTEQCTASKCVVTAVAAGQMCASGVCNGAAPEKCVTCADTAQGSAQDSGCTATKPVCDVTGSGTCYACLQDADCASDNVSCTVETCTNHVCTHVPTDGKCMPSGNVCKPSKCDATLDCKQVDISTTSALMTDDPNVGNGSFENAVDMGNAVGWTNSGADPAMIFDCTGTAVPLNGGCSGSVATTFQDDGNFVAWMGGTSTAKIDQLEHQLTLPAGTTQLLILADLNAQTVSTAASNKDSFDILLLDANKIQIGQPLFSMTNTTAQTSAPKWTADAVNKTVDVSAQAGKKIFIRLRSNVDASLKTDFFVDNVRVVATVCQ